MYPKEILKNYFPIQNLMAIFTEIFQCWMSTLMPMYSKISTFNSGFAKEKMKK